MASASPRPSFAQLTRDESFAESQIFLAMPEETREKELVRNWASVSLACSWSIVTRRPSSTP